MEFLNHITLTMYSKVNRSGHETNAEAAAFKETHKWRHYWTIDWTLLPEETY